MICQLVFQHPVELPPRRVSDGPGEPVVFHHPFYIQILYADDLVLARQLMSDLMLYVISDVGYLLMFSCKSKSCLLAVLRTFLLS